MTNQHPLTEEMMDKIHGDESGYSNPYDEDDMRAAANWQLEQVMNWLDKHLTNYLDPDYLGSCESIPDLEDDLKKAMRPTTEDQEDLRLVMERKDSIPEPITLEELSVLPTQEDN